MKQLSIKPTIHKFENAREFAQEFKLSKGDLVITNQYIWEPYFGDLNLDCDVIFQEKYGKGEPSDAMVDAIVSDIHTTPKRVIGIGGGTVLDISKVCALKQTSPLEDLVDGKIPAQKARILFLFQLLAALAPKLRTLRCSRLLSAIPRRVWRTMLAMLRTLFLFQNC